MSGRQGRPCRVDYWHDPAAPKPTSRKPSASVIVRNSAGDLLLLRRSDSGRWTIPTGGLKKNETLTQCAVRECREETGLDIEITALVGVFSDPGHVIAYADGEVRQPVNTCFSGQVIGGNLTTSDEATEAVWVPPTRLDDYDRLAVHSAGAERPRPHRASLAVGEDGGGAASRTACFMSRQCRDRYRAPRRNHQDQDRRQNRRVRPSSRPRRGAIAACRSPDDMP